MIALLLENTVAAAVLALIVVVLCRCFRLGPPARHALWLVVVLRLLSPVGLWWSVPLPAPRFLGELTGPATARAAEKGPRRSAPPASEARDRVVMLMLDTDVRAEKPPADAHDPRDVPEPVDVRALETAELTARDAEADGETAEAEGISPGFFAGLQLVWLAGAAVVAGCYGRRTLWFARYARSGKEASPALRREVEELARRLGVRSPRVRVLPNLPSPVVWCLRQPVLLWPRGLQDRVSPAGRRGVLVHELAHLRRRDHWVRWLEMAAAVLHWWNPLFWFVRRQLRVHAELACDAWVTGSFPDIRRDYAEALLEVCARFHRAAAPSPAVGVGGDGRSEFRRRLTMIMCEPAPCRLAVGAKLFLGLALLTALPAWTLGQDQAPRREDPKPAVGKELKVAVQEVLDVGTVVEEQTDADATKKVRDLEAKIAELSKQLQALRAARATAGQKKLVPLRVELRAGANDGAVRVLTIGPDGKPVETKGEPVRKTIVIGKSQAAQPAAGQPFRIELVGEKDKLQYRVIGPDGKEVKDAKVIVIGQGVTGQASTPAAYKFMAVERAVQSQVQARQAAAKALAGAKETAVLSLASGPSSQVINLTRATYTLPKDKAAALAAFLKENVKASVLEVKVEDNGLTVTTTPEAQAAVGGIARLMGQGQTQPYRVRFRSTLDKDSK